MNVRESYSRALEQGTLLLALTVAFPALRNGEDANTLFNGCLPTWSANCILLWLVWGLIPIKWISN